MRTPIPWIVAALLTIPSLAFAQRRPALPQEDGAGTEIAWVQAEAVYIAKLDGVVPGPVAQSMPPIYNHRLTLTVEKVLRGTGKPGDELNAFHSARQVQEPTFPVGKRCLVAITRSREGVRANRIVEATPELIEQVALGCALPLGWSVDNGKPLSPWANLGDNAWPADAKAPADALRCARTGRPTLLAGDVTFEVEKVPPPKEIQWTNPDGDGEYRLTVTNPTDKPVAVPALLSANGTILWEESLVILCQKRVYPCPGAKGVSAKTEPLTLEPKQKVSFTVNALKLDGPEWPRGGYRIEFQFCLGEKSKTQSFYYMSRHHDKIREGLKKGG